MRTLWERAFIVELGLGLLALGLGWLCGFSPTSSFTHLPVTENLRALANGCLLAVPMLLFVPILQRLDWQPVERIRELLAEYFGSALRSWHIWQLALLSVAAGWGEELLFRGFLQQGLIGWLPSLGAWGAILITSAAFAALHCVTWLYGLLALLASIYLGWLFETTGNLLVPVATHAVYDFFALAYVARILRRRAEEIDN